MSDDVDEVERIKRRLRRHLVATRFGLTLLDAERLLERCRWRQELAEAACVLGLAAGRDPLEVAAWCFPAPGEGEGR